MSRQSLGGGGVLLLVFLLAHLALLPRTLEDLDSVNFALGVRQFDVARHQPHPPGYPVFIAASKASTAVLRATGVSAAAPRGLAVWSAIGGAAALPALLVFFAALESRRRLAWWATVVTAAAPLYWFTALRPLSDMAGFAVAVWAVALLAPRGRGEQAMGWSADRRLVAGALLAGVAVGIRSQSAVLTFPVLAYVLVLPGAVSARARLAALAAVAAGLLSWGIPLLVVSGGPVAYLQALGTQAGEDFSGVAMLWTHHSPRAIAHALANTFVWPWDWWLGVGMSVLAAAGAARVAWRAPRAVVVLFVVFAPYAMFHLLFQETETTRYALPLVPPVAYLALAAIESRGRLVLPLASAALAALSLLLAMPASAAYAQEGAPVFRAFDDMAVTAHGGERVDTIAMHAGARRPAEWAAPILPARVAKAPHGREWLALVALWRAEPGACVWFAADPTRTDLALFDARARELVRPYRWGFVEPPFVGGARPDNIDWYRLQPPGWMLDRGWSVTAEVGGVSAREHAGPHVAPVVAWVRRRSEETMVVIGGRNLGNDPNTTVSLAVGGRVLGSWPVKPGFFAREVPVAGGTFDRAMSYVPLEVAATSAGGAPVSLEQFDIQGPDVPMLAFHEGWQEPEYNPDTGLAWRWMSERAVLWVRPIGRSVTLTLGGESPLRYYKDPARVRVRVAGREIASFSLASDFQQSVTLPADALAQASGRVEIESSPFFVPGGTGGGGDQRHLALRIYSTSVR